MASRLVKLCAFTAAVTASAIAGDCCGICDRLVYPVAYRGKLVARDSYRRPFDLRKEYRVNEDGFLEVYFGDRKMYLVSDELRVNERGLGVMLRDEAKDAVKRGGKGVGRLLDSLKGLGYGFYEGVVDDE